MPCYADKLQDIHPLSPANLFEACELCGYPFDFIPVEISEGKTLDGSIQHHTRSYKHWFCCFARSKDFVELFNGFVAFSFSLFHIFPEVYSKNAPHQLTLADWAHASEFAFDQGRWRLWECGVVEVAETSKFTVPMFYVFVYIFLCFLFQVGAFCSSSWRVRSFSPQHALGFWQICIAFCVQCTMFTEFLLTLALWRWATECCEYSTPLGSIGKITDRLREFGAVHHIGAENLRPLAFGALQPVYCQIQTANDPRKHMNVG